MNLAELTEQIRAIRDRMTREGHGRQADPGPAPDVSKALDMAAEELQVAREEVASFTEYDFVVINDELPAAVDKLRGIVIAERARLRCMRGEAERIIRTFS